jgi:hypothetical protein
MQQLNEPRHILADHGGGDHRREFIPAKPRHNAIRTGELNNAAVNLFLAAGRHSGGPYNRSDP